MLKQSQKGYVGFAFLVVWALVIIGWILNVVQVFKMMPATVGEATPMFIAKAVCVFAAPIGAVLGWVGLFS